ncbi:MAG TPA: ABC transporter ATP-binding protein [Candidatus Binataceae bacterium]|nr:ABC transporter ATP-binding protein [Candidatus Binataceae bacterium]
MKTLEATALRKSYGDRVVLDGVSLDADRGEIVGLLGPNGAGKTTTLSILATLLAADSGSVRVAGLSPRTDRDAVRRKLGYVPQVIALYPTLSALQNLALFARVHGAGHGAAAAASAHALEAVGLAPRAHDPVSSLSGGMKRRLNLACAMVHRPEILLLDEPTVGVDPQSREQILLTVKRAAESGAAIIYSTHYMEEVERICSRALLIDHGRVVAAGTVAELISLGGRQPRMEIAFKDLPTDGWIAGLEGVSEIEQADAGGRIELELASLAQVSEILDHARQSGGQVLEFSVHSPNLSDAFIALTGHALREDGGGGQ